DETATIEISARSDESWKLQVKADDALGWSPKAISDFMWKLSGSGNYTGLTEQYVQITTGTGPATLYMDYKILFTLVKEAKMGSPGRITYRVDSCFSPFFSHLSNLQHSHY
ncbi:unnamed protein product, partial [marine sediment metagenome]